MHMDFEQSQQGLAYVPSLLKILPAAVVAKLLSSLAETIVYQAKEVRPMNLESKVYCIKNLDL